MNSKCYLWLFNNINRYEFLSNEANQIKDSISRMLLTEESVNSEEIQLKMRELYGSFCTMFYNNVIGYQNGFAKGGIVSPYLDCYFVNTSEGLVPIGFYKSLRPMEALSITEKYLDECKNDIYSEKNRMVAVWQTNVDTISKGYDRVKNYQASLIVKVVLYLMLSFGCIVLSVLSLIKMDVMNVLHYWGDMEILNQAVKNIPIIANASAAGWFVYLIFIVISLTFALLGIIFGVRGIKILSNKGITNDVLNNVLSHVNNLETGVNSALQNGCSVLYDAVRRGEDINVGTNYNAMLINNIEKQFKTSEKFIRQCDEQKRAKNILIYLLVFIVIMYPLSYVQGIANGIDNIRNSMQTGSSSSASQTQQGTTEVTTTQRQKQKVSRYEAYHEMLTWDQACARAENMGGHLVCINDADEFNEVCQIAYSNGFTVFWLGAYRQDGESWDDVSWINGEDITYTSWYPGEPSYYDNDTGVNETRLMVFKTQKYGWCFNDGPNSLAGAYKAEKVGFIVEYEEWV